MVTIQHSRIQNTAGKNIVPHGWGKVINGSVSIKLLDGDLVVNEKRINVFNGECLFNQDLEIVYRDYEGQSGENCFFRAFNDQLKCSIKNTLIPIFSISCAGMVLYYPPINLVTSMEKGI